MKLAISNIAWSAAEERAIAPHLRPLGVTGVELAPARVHEDPARAPEQAIRACRAFWRGHGIALVAMQALLYGRPELRLFGSAEARRATKAYLMGIIRLAARLEVPTLVFGSPGNRARGALSETEATVIATDFFRELGDAATREGVCLCLEANPPQYGCDFITSTAQALALVRAVSSEGFGLHLDTGAMHLAGEPTFERLQASLPWARHVHFSAPQLAPLPDSPIDFPAIWSFLKRAAYPYWVSVEMRAAPDAPGGNLPTVTATLQYLQTITTRT